MNKVGFGKKSLKPQLIPPPYLGLLRLVKTLPNTTPLGLFWIALDCWLKRETLKVASFFEQARAKHHFHAISNS